MKSMTLAILVLALALPLAAADRYTVDSTHSSVVFNVRHLVSNVKGTFGEFGGTFYLEKARPAASKVEFIIKPASIDTDNADRDAHLRNEDFFDVAKFPEIKFTGRSIKSLGKNRYEVRGPLTLRGVTREVVIPVTFFGFVKDPWGNEKAGFEATVTINRKDFGMNWNKVLDAGGALLGEEVKVAFDLELVKAKPEAAK